MTPAPGRPIHLELVRLFEATVISSPAEFTFDGESYTGIDRMAAPVVEPGQPVHPVSEHPLVRVIQQVLYWRCYAHDLGTTPDAPPSGDADPDFSSLLSQANRGTARWDEGWLVQQAAHGGSIHLFKGGHQRVAPVDQVQGHSGPVLQPGTLARVWLPADSFTTQRGFYFMFGETPEHSWDDFYMSRCYFNVAPEGVPSLIEFLTSQLNRHLIPFRMKALTDPRAYSRRDSVVLYVARRYWQAVSRILCLLPREAAAALAPAVPLFSKRLLNGVGVAEDPRTGESFGMHRCRLIAEGMVDAFYHGQQNIAARARAVAKRMSGAGVDLRRPHLNPGSKDVFDLVA